MYPALCRSIAIAMFITASISVSAQTNTWTPKAALPNNVLERENATGFSINGKGYLCTGKDLFCRKDLLEYDPAANTWTNKPDFPGDAREKSFAFTIGDKAYVGGGSDPRGFYFQDMYEYNQSTNAWTRKADFPYFITANDYAKAFSIGSKGYVVYFNMLFEFDPVTNTWTRKADFPAMARTNPVAFAIASKGYFGTGNIAGYDIKSDLWEYDPAADLWTRKADMPESNYRHSAYAFTHAGKGYVGGGRYFNESVQYKDLWQYDPATNSWLMKQGWQSSRGGAVSFSIGDKAYVATGMTKNSYNVLLPTDEVLEYDISGDSWQSKGNIGGYVRFNGISASANNKGYFGLGGGHQSFPFKSDIWEYDSDANQWSRKPDFPGGGRSEAFSFTLNNKVYVGGGVKTTLNTTTFSHGVPNDLWEYDPATEQWTQKENMPGVGRMGASTFVANGKAYVGLGRSLNSTDVDLVDFYEYDPSLGWTRRADFPGQPRMNAPTFSLLDKGYVLANHLNYRDPGGYGAPARDVWQYDPILDSWTRKTNFPGGGRTEAASFSLNGKGYYGVGRDQYELYSYKSDMWEYNPVNDSWSAIDNFAGGERTPQLAFVINNKAYMGMGAGTLPLNSSWGKPSLKNDLWEFSSATPTVTIVCPSNRVTDVSANCKAVVANIDAIVTPSANTTVNYLLSGATTASGIGYVSGYEFNRGTTTVTYSLANDASKSCSFNIEVNDLIAPLITAPSEKIFCGNGVGISYDPMSDVTVTDNCSYNLLSIRSDGKPLTDPFLVGTTSLTWKAVDLSGNESSKSTSVTVHPQLIASIPNQYATASGAEANTLYIGYGSQSLLYTVQVAGGVAPYTYLWSDGSTSSSLLVSTASALPATYTVTVKDALGCSKTASVTVNLINLQPTTGNGGGNGNGNGNTAGILICHSPNNNPHVRQTMIVNPSSVAVHLAHGCSLGACSVTGATLMSKENESLQLSEPRVSVLPNPTNSEFELLLPVQEKSSSVQVNVFYINGVTREKIPVRTGVARLRFGRDYLPGMYILEVIQGSERRIIKLVKI
jgi:N-acetylneuraminic acid mutarotase